jgi:glycosyltransferase involved in cell wall biosynthesis
MATEKRGYCQIKRYSWFGYNLFPRLENYPLLEFLYLTPYLFFRSFIWLLFNHRNVSLIHSHGLNAAFIGNILKLVFKKKHICSTHTLYQFKDRFTVFASSIIFSLPDSLLCLSKKSRDQLISWGIAPPKIALYKHWIDLKKFTVGKKAKKFTCLFVGRLIPQKGISLFLKIAIHFPNLNFIIAGNGPMENVVKSFAQKRQNVNYLGGLNNFELAKVYKQASLFCICSQYPEAFGRVLMEATASGLPVVGSNLGCIPQVLDKSVSILFKPKLQNFTDAISSLSTNHQRYYQLQKKCRPYAINKFSQRNFRMISKSYQKLLDTN